MIKLTLRRTAMSGRRAYAVESVEVDGKRVRDQLLRTPNGDVHISEGDYWFAAEITDLLKDMIAGVRDWSGTDTIAIDKMPQ